eukprot:jgi/Ulvmu1/1217/UM109_0015.1
MVLPHGIACSASKGAATSHTNTVDGIAGHRSGSSELCGSLRGAPRSHRIDGTALAEDIDLARTPPDCDMSVEAVLRDRIGSRPLRDAPRLRLPDHRVRPAKSASTPPPKSRLPRFAGRPSRPLPSQPQKPGCDRMQDPLSQPSSRGSSSRHQGTAAPCVPRSRSTSKPPPYPTHPSRSRPDRAHPESDVYPSAQPMSTPSPGSAAVSAQSLLRTESHGRTSPTGPPPSPKQRPLSPMPRFNQLRDMHDDLTLDAELDLDLDEELRGMSFLRTPRNHIRTRSLSLFSQQYSMSPATSPSALAKLSSQQQPPLPGHRSLPKSLSSPVAHAQPLFPPPQPTLSPQGSLSPQKSLSRRNSLPSQGHLSPRTSLTSQLTGTSATGTLPHSPASSSRSGAMPVPVAAAPARMPCPTARAAALEPLQPRLSHDSLSTQPAAPSQDSGPTLRSSAPTSLMTATTQRSLALHGTDSDASGDLVPECAPRAPLSCQGAARRTNGQHDDAHASVAAPGVDLAPAYRSSAPPVVTPVHATTPLVAPQLQRRLLPGVVGLRELQLPGCDSSDADSNSESDDDCSMATLTLTPALAAECSELVRALAAEQSRC